MADFNIAITKTLVHEGGATITHDADDRGGLTKYGISQKAYPEIDIESLTEEQAKEIYKRDYWDMVKADQISSQEIAASIFDFAVNAGPGTAIKAAQRAANVASDGVLGPVSIGALNGMDGTLFKYRYALEKIRHYRDVVTRNSSQRKFLLGWINRSLEGL